MTNNEWSFGATWPFVILEDAFRGERTRIFPALTFRPREFSKFRLQYN
jgi:hypothetical protein